MPQPFPKKNKSEIIRKVFQREIPFIQPFNASHPYAKAKGLYGKFIRSIF